MDEIDFSIIIPAYNEEKRILKTLESYVRSLAGSGRSYEIVVVANGCTDRTVAVVREWAGTLKELRLCDHQATLGKGGAIREGLAQARGGIVGFLDADEAVSMDQALELIQRLKEDPSVDCVIGSKWKGRDFGSVPEPLLRKVLSRAWNRLVRAALGLDFRDTQAGAKFMRREAYRALGEEFVCSGFEFDVELLARLQRRGARIEEVPIRTEHVEGSTFRYRHMFRMLLGLGTIWWRQRGDSGKKALSG